MTATGSAQNWRSAAACRSADQDLFFPIAATGPAARQIARAKTICAGCGVRREWPEFALTHEQKYGIWGGATPAGPHRDPRRRAGAGGGAAPAAGAGGFARAPAPPARPRRAAG